MPAFATARREATTFSAINEMKSRYIVIFFLIIYSCNQSNRDKVVKTSKNNASFNIETVDNEKTNSTPEIQIHQVNQSLTEFEIANSIFVLDTMGNDFSKLIGKVDKWTNRYLVMFPDTSNNKVMGVYSLNDTLKIIPFYLDGDMESQIFTMWRVNHDSTLSYIRKISSILNSKYAHLDILKHFSFKKNETLFIGNTFGSEGGEMWESLWIAKYNGKEDMSKIDIYETGYNDGENSKSIDYVVKGKVIQIFLKVDSLIYKEDTTIVISKSREFVKSFKLN